MCSSDLEAERSEARQRMEQNYVGKVPKDACSLPGLFRQNHRKLKDYDRWEAVYTERCTYGFGARQWKPAVVIPQGAIVLAYNLQREHILPSERAKAYQMKLEAMKRQAGRKSKENVSQVGTQKRTDEMIAEEFGTSRNQVQRFVRLNNLIPEIMDMVDEKKIAFNPAVELSYLKPEEQREFLEAMDYAQTTPSVSQAQRIKKLSQQGQSSLEAMCEVMDEVKKPPDDKLVIKSDVLRKYFPKSYTNLTDRKSVV